MSRESRSLSAGERQSPITPVACLLLSDLSSLRAGGADTAPRTQLQEPTGHRANQTSLFQQAPRTVSESPDCLLTIASDRRQLANTANGQTLAIAPAVVRRAAAGRLLCHASERQPRRGRRLLSSSRRLGPGARNQRIPLVGNRRLVGAARALSRAVASRAKHKHASSDLAPRQ
jgi:hypothetical protein